MSDLRDQVTPADLSGREPPLREQIEQLRDRLVRDIHGKRYMVPVISSLIACLNAMLKSDAARTPSGLEAELRHWIADRRDSQTPTTFGVVADLMEALLNSTLPADPADRAWDAATGVVRNATDEEARAAGERVVARRRTMLERLAAHDTEAPVADTIQALKNSGIDTECGACMEVAFTGVTTNAHTCAPVAETPPAEPGLRAALEDIAKMKRCRHQNAPAQPNATAADKRMGAELSLLACPYCRARAALAEPGRARETAPAPQSLKLLTLLAKAQPEFCSMRCPSYFTSPDQPRHLPECRAMREALSAAPPAQEPT